MRGEAAFSRLEKYSSRFLSTPSHTSSDLPQVSTFKLPVRARRSKSSMSPISLPAYKALERVSLDSQSSSIPPPRPIEVTSDAFQSQSEEMKQKFRRAWEDATAGKLTTAIGEYGELLAAEPNNSDVRVNLGVALMSLGRLKDALRVLREKADARMQYNSAVCCVLLQEWKMAREALELAQRLDPLHALERNITDAQTYILSQLPAKGPVASSSQPDLIGHLVQGEVGEWEEASSRPRTRSSRGFRKGGSPEGKVAPGDRTMDPAKSAMWKAFKSIDEYDGRGTSRPQKRGHTPIIYNVRAESSRSVMKAHSRKRSFITAGRPTPIKFRTPTKEKRRVPTVEDEEDAYQFKEKGKAEGKKKIPLQRIRKQGSFMQEDLEDEEKLRQLQFDVDQEEAVRRKFAEVSAIVQKEADKLHKANTLIADLNLEKTINGRLTREALATVRVLFASDRSPRSQSRLLSILSPLKFFSRFQQEVRSRLLDIAEHRTYPAGETIFQQGETGSLMFVILYGSVLVQKQTAELGQEPLTIGTLYDGDSFGELSLFVAGASRGNTARPVSCVAGEPCDLLAIPKLSFHNIIMQQVETAIETKLTFLASLPLFEGAQQVNLIPLASHLEPAKYRFGEVVIRRGEKPTGLFIVMKGLCKVYSEGYRVKMIDGEKFASARVKMTPSARPFIIGNSDYATHAQTHWTYHSDPALVRSSSMQSIATPATHVPKDKVLLATLQAGDYFGGRCLLTEDDIQNPEAEGIVEPAKCTIIAESAEVLLFLLKKSHLMLLGEKLSEQVREKLGKAFEYDCPQHITKAEFRSDFQQWSRYKKDLVDRTFRSWFVRRNKQRIISALRDN